MKAVGFPFDLPQPLPKMKQLQYLSIQGRCAPSFWFKHHDAQAFRSLTESITLSSTLIVSSIYRTDVFFSEEGDKADLIIRTWAAFKRLPYDLQTKEKFIRADNKQEAFELYFDTLFHLMQHPTHYERYKQRLWELQLLDKTNPILCELMQCDLHLADLYRQQKVNYPGLAQADPKLQNKSAPENFGLLAQKCLPALIYN